MSSPKQTVKCSNEQPHTCMYVQVMTGEIDRQCLRLIISIPSDSTACMSFDQELKEKPKHKLKPASRDR
jgi:hypothetical protein